MKKELILNLSFLIITSTIIISILLNVKGYKTTLPTGNDISGIDNIITIQKTGILYLDIKEPIYKVALNDQEITLHDNYAQGIKPGKYTLRINDDKFIPYTAEIEIIEEKVTRLNAFLLQKDYTEESSYKEIIGISDSSVQSVILEKQNGNILNIVIKDNSTKELILKKIIVNDNPILLQAGYSVETHKLMSLADKEIVSPPLAPQLDVNPIETNNQKYVLIKINSSIVVFDQEQGLIVKEISKIDETSVYKLLEYNSNIYIARLKDSLLEIISLKDASTDLSNVKPAYKVNTVENIGEYNGILYFIKGEHLYLLNQEADYFSASSYDTDIKIEKDSYKLFIQKDLDRLLLWNNGKAYYLDKYFNIIQEFETSEIMHLDGYVGQYVNTNSEIYILNVRTDKFELSGKYSRNNCIYLGYRKDFCIVSKENNASSIYIPSNPSIQFEKASRVWELGNNFTIKVTDGKGLSYKIIGKYK